MTAKEMNETLSDILLAVAHPSEEEAVREAVTGSCCEILVTGLGRNGLRQALCPLW